MASAGELLFYGYAVTCEVTPYKNESEIQRSVFQSYVEPRSKKMRSPNSSDLGPLTRDLSGLDFVERQNGQVFTAYW